jgi:type I restriction enzyme, S subunit
VLRSEAFFSAIEPLQRGTSYPAVSDSDVLSQRVPVAPAAEQVRIAQKLDKLLGDLDDGLAEILAAQEKLLDYSHSSLVAAMRGDASREWREAVGKVNSAANSQEQKWLADLLAARRQAWERMQLENFAALGKAPPKNWSDRYPEPIPLRDPLPHTLPQGWKWVTLSQIGLLDRGRSRHRPRNAPHLFGGPYPFVQTGDIAEAKTFLRKASATYNAEGLAQSRLWPKGTLCVTVAANIGSTAILDMNACFPDSVVGFLPAGEEICVRFVEYFLRTVKLQLEAEAPATAQKSINLARLQSIPVPMPPRLEQEEIVSRLDLVMNAIAAQELAMQQAKERAEAQRRNVVETAVTGRLVPQSDSDEPAIALLERIQANLALRATRQVVPNTRRLKNAKETSSMKRIYDVLEEAGDWLSAQEAFRRCGVVDGSDIDRIEGIYAELRVLGDTNRLQSRRVGQFDELRLTPEK